MSCSARRDERRRKGPVPFASHARSVLASAALAVAFAAGANEAAAAKPPASQPAPASAELVVVADAPAARKSIIGIGGKLPEPWHLGDETTFGKALTTAGQRGPASAGLGTAAGRAALAKRARTAAKATGARAVLFVKATPKKTTRVVSVFLVPAAEGDAPIDMAIEVPATDDGARIADALAPALARLAPAPPSPAETHAEPPPERRPGPAPTPADERDDVAKPRLGGAESAILIFAAGGGTGSRTFSYHQGLSPTLRRYDLTAAPAIALAAEVYPAARSSTPVVKWLGIGGGFEHALALSSETSSGTSVSTSWTTGYGDLRMRLPFGEEGRFVLGLRGGILYERFGFTGDAMLASALPDVSYLFWRLGADARVRVGPVALLATGSYLPAIAGGDVADRFRDTAFAGVELGGGLAVPLVRVFELRALATYTRIFYAFHPEVGDVNVAGGALDEMVRAQLLATLLL